MNREGDDDLAPDVLAGAVDLHVHGYPDASPAWRMRMDDRAMVAAARDAGMGAVVLKSHFWPTMDRARMLQEELGDTDFTVHSSVTLNPLVGGISPATVEAAVAHGAAVVFMPTWGARNDHRHCGFVRTEIIEREFPRLAGTLGRTALSVLDGAGRLRAEAAEILDIAADGGQVVSTGHLSAPEALALAERAAEIGFDRLVFGHPLAASVGADPSALRRFVELGGYVELTAVQTMLAESPVPLETVHDTIAAVGVANVVLTSDVYFDWMPPHTELLRVFAGRLRDRGLTLPEVRTMLVDTPRRLLGLPVTPTPTLTEAAT